MNNLSKKITKYEKNEQTYALLQIYKQIDTNDLFLDLFCLETLNSLTWRKQRG